MRIVAGTARGTRLDCPRGEKVRPTPEMARQAIFNILGNAVDGATVLDLFAGVGTVGIEALSRGAAWCVFVERSNAHKLYLERNLERCHVADLADVILRDVFRCADVLAKLARPADIAFVGPPFPLLQDPPGRASLMRLLDEFAARGLFKPGGIIILQHDQRDPIPESTPHLRAAGRRNYGRNVFTLYQAGAAAD